MAVISQIVQDIKAFSVNWPLYDGYDVPKLVELRKQLKSRCLVYGVPFLDKLKSLSDEDLGEHKDDKDKIEAINDVLLQVLASKLQGAAIDEFNSMFEDAEGKVMLYDWLKRTDRDLQTLYSDLDKVEAELTSIQLKNKQGLTAYRQIVEKIVSKLQAGGRFKENDVVEKLVSNLPSQARVYMEDKMEAVEDNKKTMVTFWAILKRAVMCMTDVPAKRGEAYRARRVGPRQKNASEGKGFRSFNGNCHYCQGHGHKKADCEAWRAATQGPKSGNDNKCLTRRKGISDDGRHVPAVNMTTVRTLMALAAYQHYHVHQVNVKPAFMHTSLDEGNCVHVRRDPEARLGGYEYARLNNAESGQKSASRAWYHELDQHLRDTMQCRRLRLDECVYAYKEDKDIVWAMVYVNDILLVGSTERVIDHFKHKLKGNGKFKSKDFGQLKNFCNMEFEITTGSVTIKQTAYIDSILKEFNMASCKPVRTPWTTGAKLERVTKSKGDFPYRQLLGKLKYLASHTRPDIAATVSFLNAHSQFFDETHWQAAKRLLRYLKGTKDFGIRFEDTQELQLSVYTNAGFAQEHDKKAHEGCVIFLCNGPIHWHSNRQTTTATSTAEAEYMATHRGAAEGLGLRELICELLIVPELKPFVYCDNQTAITNVIDGNAQSERHHVLIRFYALREMHERNQIDIVYCPADNMMADVLTKPVSRDAHECRLSSICTQGRGVGCAAS